MDLTYWEAIILGIIQGLTEFLPVSSSGHLELAGYLFGFDEPDNLAFTAALHGGTVLSTIVVFRHELRKLIKGFFEFRMNPETIFILNILISLVPIVFVGFMFEDRIESLFTGNILLVGCALLVTACLLTFANYAKPRTRPVTPQSAFIIGIAQAVAVIPGISRSGATISAGLMQGLKREEVSKFSFLMVLIPIIGMNLLAIFKMPAGDSFFAGPVIAGFLTAFVVGTAACRWMIRLVNRGKLIWFAIYCAAVGSASIIMSFVNP
ncbi:MAG: undecaprenyl-diphosphate phosphatase [Rikenellaceae bacterium]|nr:undecaprenyl-diphosphate phosphatase [Rikenellaceae bacterium]